MKVGEFEEAVWKTDRIRIVIRASANSEVRDYEFQIAAPSGKNITWLLNTRIRPRVGDLEVTVLRGGDGAQPNGNVILQTLRATYSQ